MEDNKGNGGIGLDVVLFLIFLVLKLCKVINWSWWWVTSPLWIGLIFIIVVAIIATIIDKFN